MHGFCVPFIVVGFILTTFTPLTATANSDGEGDVSTESQAAVTSSGEGVTVELGATLRPRVEGRFNQHFELPESELNYPHQPYAADSFSQQTRLMADIDADRVSAHLTLQHTSQWGDFGGDELTHPPLHIYEARLRYHPSQRLFVDIGRFELAYGDLRVLGNVGWSQIGRSWDGLRLGIRSREALDLDLFATSYADGDEGFLDDDSFLFGAYATLNEPFGALLDTLDLYLLYDLEAFDNAEGRDLYMVGTRLDAGAGDFDFNAEGGIQLISSIRPDNEWAYFYDLEISHPIDTSRIFVGHSMASGDDPDSDLTAYDQLYPTAHAWMGYMDLVGPRSNLMELRGGLQTHLGPASLEAKAHLFQRLQPDSEIVGTELNAKLFAPLTEHLTLGIGGGLFFGGDGLSPTDTAPEGVAAWGFSQLAAEF